MIPACFSALKGNARIKSYLQQMVNKKAIGNSLLFAGQEGIGKGLFANALAALVMNSEEGEGRHNQKIEKGQHPDLHYYCPEGKLGLHSIQTMRDLSEEVHLPPYEAKWKVFIIHEAERMLSYSANALLKTFEEPPPRTLIILLSQSAKGLLPTIVSRCRTLRFQPVASQEIEEVLIQNSVDPIQAKTFAQLCHGSIGRALHLAKKGGDPNRTYLLNALTALPLTSYKDLGEVVGTLAEQIESTKKEAEDAAKEELHKISGEYLTAAHQQSLEKEIEGFSALASVKETQALFDQLLSWYRDLQLLLLSPTSPYLINLDYREQMEQVVQRGNLLSFTQVQKAIDEAQLALQRSTSLSICLENLFLKLRWI
ncbi:MAG: DNA polymerase III subunit delta' [Candidatus Protochlamydia sp.]|nr:DNA polymerase III subunit delta' [Candidatus Protochlamydia sp.]